MERYSGINERRMPLGAGTRRRVGQRVFRLVDMPGPARANVPAHLVFRPEELVPQDVSTLKAQSQVIDLTEQTTEELVDAS